MINGNGFAGSRRKYGNHKVEIDGFIFDSKREAVRWQQLKLLERAGQISALKRQVKFDLLPSQKNEFGKTERAVSYIADFTYYDKDGHLVVEDTKGFRTDAYILKRKLMLHMWNITIHEI
ncbi:DUF1064 domain-containing protein [Treponema sp.]|uniref:DUF1064 domain-containing protein n=1 Tax=Treponema sp. TaxID=166 RepID=UPI003890C940